MLVCSRINLRVIKNLYKHAKNKNKVIKEFYGDFLKHCEDFKFIKKKREDIMWGLKWFKRPWPAITMSSIFMLFSSIFMRFWGILVNNLPNCWTNFRFVRNIKFLTNFSVTSLSLEFILFKIMLT